MKRFSVICLQCGLSVKRLIDVETMQTEIHPVSYRQKCKITPDAADFDCPELKSGMSRPASSDDAIVFPEALSGAAVKNQKLVAEKAEQSAEAAALRAPVDATDMVDAAPTPFDEGSMLDELRRALHSGEA
jgi:hypothetical protein